MEMNGIKLNGNRARITTFISVHTTVMHHLTIEEIEARAQVVDEQTGEKSCWLLLLEKGRNIIGMKSLINISQNFLLTNALRAIYSMWA